jgi:hypothetical protein
MGYTFLKKFNKIVTDEDLENGINFTSILTKG